MITNSTARWLVFLANIIAFVFALLLVASDKMQAHELPVLIFFVVLFIVDALCAVPYIPAVRTP